jgi:hypothetical protein
MRTQEEYELSAFYLVASLVLSAAIVIIACSIAKADDYTDEQIVNAIYKAEGGANAKYPYGIRSVKCSTTAECRKVCVNTVKNNRQRFAHYGRFEFESFIAFLSSRYAPINAGNDKKGLNRNWLKNVNYFLAKEVSK